jgi:chromate transporter
MSQLNPAAPSGAEHGAELVPVSLRELVMYFLRLGTLGVGGPIALASYMQRDLVERRRWISKQDYVRGLALAHPAALPGTCGLIHAVDVVVHRAA